MEDGAKVVCPWWPSLGSTYFNAGQQAGAGKTTDPSRTQKPAPLMSWSGGFIGRVYCGLTTTRKG